MLDSKSPIVRMTITAGRARTKMRCRICRHSGRAVRIFSSAIELKVETTTRIIIKTTTANKRSL
jgi:hypothetical protein